MLMFAVVIGLVRNFNSRLLEHLPFFGLNCLQLLVEADTMHAQPVTICSDQLEVKVACIPSLISDITGIRLMCNDHRLSGKPADF